MRVLFITTDYPAFLDSFYASHPGLAAASYAEQMRRRNETLFANADFYSRGVAGHGGTSADLYMNNATLQLRWAGENGVAIPGLPWRYRLRRALARAPVVSRFVSPPGWVRPPWFLPVLAAQIQAFRPDVIVNQDTHNMQAAMLRSIGSTARLIVGQTNSYLDPSADYGAYDLVLTAFPNYVRDFSAHGVTARLSRLAFEPTVLDRLRPAPRSLPVSFVGGIDTYHQGRVALLEYLCRHMDVAIWGPGIESLPPDSAIRRCYRGPAWGRDMFQIFRESAIVLNHELPISRPYGANMRFYEATGCGALLLTDRRDVAGMFEPGRELVFYDDPPECLRRIEELLADPPRARAIADAGQRRTLRDHTYAARGAELVGVFSELLGETQRAHAAAQ